MNQSGGLPGEDRQQELVLPAVQIVPVSYSVGKAYLTLREPLTTKVVERSEIRISPRVSEEVLSLQNGDQIILSDRRFTELPEGIDGILQRGANDELKWLFHRLQVSVQEEATKRGWAALSFEREKQWDRQVYLRAETRKADGTIDLDAGGLRPPQLGALHNIGGHWSIYQTPATIVLPTGTGKTEVILCTRAAFANGPMLVIVPSDILRSQTARKFLTFGLLRKLGVLDTAAANPIVGVVIKRPASVADLDILEGCNVIIATVSSICMGAAESLSNEIASRCGCVVIDEAHHLGASKLTSFKAAFTNAPVLQFTATPYRRDKRIVDGRVIFNYPMRMAQRDGYFKKITFEPVYELDHSRSDQAIARKGIEILRRDLAQKKNHILMARCEDIKRAELVFPLYEAFAKDLNPMLVHSEMDDTDARIERLRAGEVRIVVCVNMLGEGFDLPELKIAAIHDMHRSLAVLLQFTGRFTRTAGDEIGDATVVGNIADPDVSAALERLYSEDADWNDILSELSSDAARDHAELVDFLRTSRNLGGDEENEVAAISTHLLQPPMSTLTYRASAFRPQRFHEGLPKNMQVEGVWLHEASSTLFFVTRTEPKLRWTRSKEIRDRQWALFVLHYDDEQKLLFLASTDHASMFSDLAKAVGGEETMISGDDVFRSLGQINRLVFQNVGVKKHGRRNLSYASYTGSDVAVALGIAERSGSVKNNLAGTGWENGQRVAIGCSYKGRVWAREVGSIPSLVKWCEGVGRKLLDVSIDTKDILAHVLVPEEVTELPDKAILAIEWPVELLAQSEERILLGISPGGEGGDPFYLFELGSAQSELRTSTIQFDLRTGEIETIARFALRIGGEGGFNVTQISGSTIFLKVSAAAMPLSQYLNDYPPLVRFVDLSELDGNMLIQPQDPQELAIDEKHFEVWDWTGIDRTKESIWKRGIQRRDSIQACVANRYVQAKFEIVFDDDCAGEAADLVCLKEESDHIKLSLIHCKFSGGQEAGERIKDVVEVCSQAIRSAKWKWKFRDLLRHISGREERLRNDTRKTRFLAGKPADVSKFAKLHRFKEVRVEIAIAQPGISFANRSPDQDMILASTATYLKETIGADLSVICDS